MTLAAGRLSGTYAEERLLNAIAGELLLTENFSGGAGANPWTTPGTEEPATAWTLGTGPSPTSTTGTSGGADPVTRVPAGGNAYRFTEAEQAGPWSLESPRFDASKGTLTLTFDVHMRFGSLGGIADGTLRVQGWDGADWSNIGAAIVGSQQGSANELYKPSFAFSTYASTGFDNEDFRFRLFFTKGASTFTVNYDTAVDNLVIRGPVDAGPIPDEEPPPPAGPFIKPNFGSAFAPWAIPAAFIPTHPQNNQLKNELFTLCPGRFNLNHQRFSPAIYNLAQANTTVPLFGRGGTALINSNIAAGTQIPWNTQLFSTPQNFDANDQDSYVLLIDFNTGECFEFFQTRFIASTRRLECSVALKIKQGINNTGTPDGNVITKDNGFTVSRASGIQHAVGLVTRAEINAGIIPHVMTAIWRRPSRFEFEPPAIKGAGAGGAEPGRGHMGLRIVWDGLTNADINNWLNTQPASTRPVLRIIAECIRTYGFMGTDGGGSADELRRGATQLEHTLTAKWSDFGMSHASSLFALHSLLEPNLNKSRVLAPAEHVGGNRNNVACYRQVPYPSNHPCFGF